MRRRPRLLLLAIAVLLLPLAPAACGGSGDSAKTSTQPGVATTAASQNGDRDSFEQIPEINRKLQPSVVAIVVRGRGEGSGVVMGPRQIVTNHHVVGNAKQVELALASGERITGQVRASAPGDDLAVVTPPRDLPPATFADTLPPVGSLAVAIGNPLGFENTVTAGIVSGLDRSIPADGSQGGDGPPALVNLLQTDAPISPGNSGGALVNAAGEVIGISVAYIPPQAGAVAIGFAIPAPTVKSVIADLLPDGKVEYAYLGAQLVPLTPDIVAQLGVNVDTGAVIVGIAKGSPADAAGLAPGDIIVKAGDQSVEGVEDVYAALHQRKPGDKLTLEVLRGKHRRTVEVTLARRPGP